MTSRRWLTVYAITAVFMGLCMFCLFLSVPEFKGATDWTGQLIVGGWMAWSFPIATFFWLITCTLLVFTLLAIRYPEQPKKGILGIETTRGDRLFIFLLGSAFINIAWIGLSGQPQWQALIICLVYGVTVFRLV